MQATQNCRNYSSTLQYLPIFLTSQNCQIAADVLTSVNIAYRIKKRIQNILSLKDS